MTGYLFSTYSKFSEKLTFLIPWYAREMSFSRNPSKLCYQICRSHNKTIFQIVRQVILSRSARSLHMRLSKMLDQNVFTIKLFHGKTGKNGLRWSLSNPWKVSKYRVFGTKFPNTEFLALQLLLQVFFLHLK